MITNFVPLYLVLHLARLPLKL
eukprot:COSAG05_NODE_18745_length_303_cov_1.406863_1_plen_21_part_01